MIVLGAGAISEAHESTRTQAAEDHLQELDARLSTLAAADDQPHVEFNPQDSLARNFQLRRDGYINVTVDGNPACSFEHNFSTIAYEDSQGRTVGLEAGGVWRADVEGSSAVSEPDVSFTRGRLSVGLVNLTGHIDQTTNVARLNVSATENASRLATDALRQGPCVRPDYVTVWVNSTFQAGWENYLASETGVPPGQVDSFSNGSVRANVTQSFLHDSVNDSQNTVINLGGAPYMDSITFDNDTAPPTLGVDKGVGNTYSVFVEPLSEGQLGFGRPKTVTGLDFSRPPMDVSLVLDESGSMGDPTASGSQDKIDAAKDAAQNFTTTLNSSRDRVSIQTYNDDAFYRTVNGYHFSSDYTGSGSAVNDTIQNGFFAGGSTRIDKGLNYSLSVHDLKSNENRAKFTILLTDGRNNACSSGDPTYDCEDNVRTLESAWRADNNSVTIFTIGFGSNVNEELLKDVANATGGEYYPANDSAELNDAFQDIGKTITAQNAIAATPMTSNVTTSGGQLYDADIPGDTSQIAQVTAGSETFMNINDPTAPALFSHSYAMTDGETSSFNVTRYDCEPNSWNLTERTRTVSGSTYYIARCTDIGDKNGSFAADIYVDGDRPQTLLETTYEPWQDDVNESLDAFPSVNINATTGELEAKTNQALIVYDLPPLGGGSTNTLTYVFQIGLAESEGQGIVSVQVSEVTFGNT